MALELKDKVILITGSTTGIGRAIARKSVAEGARIMIHGRREEAAIALCEELGSQSEYVVADLADADAPPRIVAETIKRFGRIDILVNNAALTTRGNLETTDVELFDKLISVNLRAPFLLSQSAVPQMKKQGQGGVIVNIGSINAYCGQTDLLVYSLTKGALMTLTRNLADVLGPDRIRVVQLNVGWTATENEIKLKQSEGLSVGWEQCVPIRYAPSGKLLTPEDVAEHVAFWISPKSAPASGVVLEVEQFPVIGRQDNRQADDL